MCRERHKRGVREEPGSGFVRVLRASLESARSARLFSGSRRESEWRPCCQETTHQWSKAVVIWGHSRDHRVRFRLRRLNRVSVDLSLMEPLMFELDTAW